MYTWIINPILIYIASQSGLLLKYINIKFAEINSTFSILNLIKYFITYRHIYMNKFMLYDNYKCENVYA